MKPCKYIHVSRKPCNLQFQEALRLINKNTFIWFVRTMEAFENPMLLATVAIGAAFLAAVSSLYQLYGPETEGKVKPKAVLRDGILGAIFTAMAWSFAPESMKGVADSLSASMASTPSITGGGATKSVSFSSDYDIQVGPARF
jgi:hypothetical protein